MSLDRFAIPLDELERGVHVPVTEQVSEQVDRRLPAVCLAAAALPFGDGMSGDADGD